MKRSIQEQFNLSIKEILERIDIDEINKIEESGKIIYDIMKEDGILHVFATGHSHMIAEELLYRAGGLVQINPILVPSLMQHEGAVTSTQLERKTGMALSIYESTDIRKNEPMMIISNSGINSVVVEMAKIAIDNKHPLIVITSMEMTTKTKPRTIDNKKLYEYGDIVIDNHTPYMDGVIKYEYGKTGASSSISSIYIVQKIVLNIIQRYLDDGKVPPVYMSANTEGGDEHNKKYIKKFQKRIKALK